MSSEPTSDCDSMDVSDNLLLEENTSPTCDNRPSAAPPAQSSRPPTAPPVHEPTLSSIAITLENLSQRLDGLERGYKRKAGSQLLTSGQKRGKPSTSTADVEESLIAPNTASTEEKAVQDLEDELVHGAEQETEIEEDIFTEMASSFDDSEEKGPPVSDKLAELLNSRFGSKLPDKKLREKLAAYPIPQNCPNMEVPQTNQEVYSALHPYARKADVRMRHTQKSMAKAAVAITLCTNTLLQVRETLATVDPTQLKATMGQCIANLTDALGLTSHAIKDLSQKRRDMHRPHLPPESAGICAPHIPMTAQWLYPPGTEFHKILKEARETRKLGQDMRGQRRGQGQSQWHRPGTSQGGAFLGRQPWKQGNRKPWHQGKAKGGNPAKPRM